MIMLISFNLELRSTPSRHFYFLDYNPGANLCWVRKPVSSKLQTSLKTYASQYVISSTSVRQYQYNEAMKTLTISVKK